MSNINGLGRSVGTGIFSVGLMAMNAGRARAQQYRADQRVRGTVGRWMAYARQLEQQLDASRRREQQLAADLADAMRVISDLERKAR